MAPTHQLTPSLPPRSLPQALLEKALKARGEKDGDAVGVTSESEPEPKRRHAAAAAAAAAAGQGEAMIHGVPASQLAGSRSCPVEPTGAIANAGAGGGAARVAIPQPPRRGNVTNAAHVIHDTEEHRRQVTSRALLQQTTEPQLSSSVFCPCPPSLSPSPTLPLSSHAAHVRRRNVWKRLRPSEGNSRNRSVW